MCFAKPVYEERERDVRQHKLSRSDKPLNPVVVGNILRGGWPWTFRKTGPWRCNWGTGPWKCEWGIVKVVETVDVVAQWDLRVSM